MADVTVSVIATDGERRPVDTSPRDLLSIRVGAVEILLEAFIRGGRRGFQLRVPDGTLLISPASAAAVEIWAEASEYGGGADG